MMDMRDQGDSAIEDGRYAGGTEEYDFTTSASPDEIHDLLRGWAKAVVTIGPVIRRARRFHLCLFHLRSPGDQLHQLVGLFGEGNHQLGIRAL